MLFDIVWYLSASKENIPQGQYNTIYMKPITISLDGNNIGFCTSYEMICFINISIDSNGSFIGCIVFIPEPWKKTF